jgi:hypothetical protein
MNIAIDKNNVPASAGTCHIHPVIAVPMMIATLGRRQVSP